MERKGRSKRKWDEVPTEPYAEQVPEDPPNQVIPPIPAQPDKQLPSDGPSDCRVTVLSLLIGVLGIDVTGGIALGLQSHAAEAAATLSVGMALIPFMRVLLRRWWP